MPTLCHKDPCFLILIDYPVFILKKAITVKVIKISSLNKIFKKSYYFSFLFCFEQYTVSMNEQNVDLVVVQLCRCMSCNLDSQDIMDFFSSWSV